MFFIFSKILYFIIQPIVWLVFFLARAACVKSEIKRKKILRGMLWATLIFTNPFISNLIFHAWEYEAVPIDNLKKQYEVGIVLGGYSEFDVYPQDRLNFNFAANRLVDAIVLYKKGIIKKILISGGDGRLVGTSVNEADMTLHHLLSLGIPSSDILIENKSRNTHENASFTQILLQQRGLDTSPCLLITSASHMRRSLACFKKTALLCDPFPAHFIAEKIDYTIRTTILPDKLAFNKWEVFLKEWIGYCVYKLQGYI